MKQRKLVIVGGGITGLSAAFYAQKWRNENQLDLDITLVEKSAFLGGKVQTLHRDGFTIEKGPDSFLARKLPMIHLAEELGLTDALTGTNPEAKKTYILHQDRLHRMPPGLSFGIPTELGPFVKTGLISPAGKARAAMDLILPKKKGNEDESLGDFLERRLGREVVHHIVEPLLAGIYAGDTKKLSLNATFPQFAAMEQKYRSLILGMIASKKKTLTGQPVTEAAKNSVFLSFKGGLATLINRLENTIDQVQVLKGKEVTALETPAGVTTAIDSETASETDTEHRYHLRLDDETTLSADSVILTVPSPLASKLLEPHGVGQDLSNIQYVSVANVILAFNREDISAPLDGSGFVVPRKEGRSITACTWTSSKWSHTAPDRKVLIRCYVGRAGDEAISFLPEEKLLEKVRHDLNELTGIDAEPLFYHVNRWPNSMPQYPVGHVEMIRKVREDLTSKLPGIYVTGAGYGGVGLPDCVQNGRVTAEQALAALQRL